jgi:ABC-2 type transport system permease protein
MTTTTLPSPTISFSSHPVAPGWWRPAASLCQRELVRFLRQRHRIIGALATPIVFWLLIGGGMQHSFAEPGQVAGSGGAGGGFMAYFFPGTILMILLFTAIFSTISIIEDRREGFLQSVLIAPIPRSAIVLGKVLGGTILAVGQGSVFLLLAPTIGIHFTILGLVELLVMMTVVSFALTALGFCIAWPMSSTQGFHAIMNLFLVPMLFLSGAMFPASGAVWPIRWVMAVNPLTYGLDGMRRALYTGTPSVESGPAFAACFGISVAFAAVLFVLAGRIARRSIDNHG